MNQKVWGKCAWVLIHSIAINYPNNPSITEKEKTINFFKVLGDVLPCRYCREHYKEHLKELPINADSKKELIWWTIDMHNKVNETTGKKILSRNEALQKLLILYKKYPDNPECYQLTYIYLLLFIALIVSYIILSK